MALCTVLGEVPTVGDGMMELELDQAEIQSLLYFFSASEGPQSDLPLWASVSSSVNEDSHTYFIGFL